MCEFFVNYMQLEEVWPTYLSVLVMGAWLMGLLESMASLTSKGGM